jgi:hypothetical protein
MDNYHKEIIKLEDEIFKLISRDKYKTAHFEYKNDEVNTYTYNSKTMELFLLFSTKGDYIKALNDTLCYLKRDKDYKPVNYNSYTVTWERIGRNEKNISYFYCSDVIEVIEKFFKNKDKELYQIFDIKMNPIS